MTEAERATLNELVAAAVTSRPAHAQQLRNRMIDAARGTANHRLVLRATDKQINTAALEQDFRCSRMRVTTFGYLVPAWSRPQAAAETPPAAAEVSP